MMSFLRGGMKPRSGVAAALVVAGTAVSAPCVVGFVFVAAAPADADPCDATIEDAVKDVFAAFPVEDVAEAEGPCVAFTLADGALCSAAVFAVPCDEAAADADAEPAAVELSVACGDDVAGAAAVAAGLASAAGFDAVCAVPELDGGVAVATTALTAC